MAYPPEVEARIKELEAELKILRSERKGVMPTESIKKLCNATSLVYSAFENHISYLCRAVTAKSGAASYGKSAVKTVKEMDFEEVVNANACAEELIAVLLKYAKQTYGEGVENTNG